ncbi:MAG TPA: DUF5979 domain-containing protein [Anaerovoracaceae bacterium]|nr:DUF5979 domain-containing protein [Anaerovoracaceae bacterium]
MKKSSRRWKVFVIVLCMLFTMTPLAVFADDPADPPLVFDQSNGDNPTGPGITQGDKPDNSDTVSPPAIPNPETPPPPPDTGTPPAITDTVSPPAVKMQNVAPMSETYYGTLTIEKKVKDKPESVDDAEFTFTIEKIFFNWDSGQWESNLVGSPVTIVGADTADPITLEIGYYRITEKSVNNYWIAENKRVQEKFVNYMCNTDAIFTNKYIGSTPPPPTTGGITISKVLAGDPAPATDFTFSVIGSSGTKSVTIPGDGSETINGLTPGAYIVSETTVQNFTPDGNDKPVTITAGEVSTISFTNTYDDPTPPPSTTGSITIVKEIEGDEPENTATFNFRIQNEAYSTQVYVSGETSETAINIPEGTYIVTEDPYPGYTPRTNGKEVIVVAGETSTVTFVNDYDDHEELILKEVALYNGVDIPTSGFTDRLQLDKLNETVIYRISFGNHEMEERNHVSVELKDIYDFDGENDDSTEDITFDLQVWFDDELVEPDGWYSDGTYYYVDTLTKNGTYTNTIYLCGETPRYLTGNGDGNECEAIASSQAIVVVNSTTPGPDPDPDPDPPNGGNHNGGSTHYYDVTYNANYPSGAGISGTVPKDTNDYSYNSKVSVRGNTGDLKAGTYTFIGWNTKADGSGTMYLPGNTFNIKEDTILYAQWKLVGESAANMADPNAGTDGGGAVTAETVQTGLDDVPKTGTGAPLILMFLLGLLSLAGITLGRKKILD